MKTEKKTKKYIGEAIFFAIFFGAILFVLGWIFFGTTGRWIGAVLGILVGIPTGISAGKDEDKKLELLESKKKQIASLPSFTVSKSFVGQNNNFIIAFDNLSYKLVIYINSIKIFNYNDIISCEIIEDEELISKKSTIRTIGGTVLGGALAGIGGAVVGGLSGKSTNKKTVSTLKIKLLTRNLENPAIVLNCFDASQVLGKNKKYVPVTNQSYLTYRKIADNIKDQIFVIIDMVDSGSINKVIENEPMTKKGTDQFNEIDWLILEELGKNNKMEAARICQNQKGLSLKDSVKYINELQQKFESNK
jgi:hypothetical protein